MRVPVIDLEASPLADGHSPVRVHYRDVGTGSPIVFLHSGWGYEVYPCDRQMAALAAAHRFVIPDRSGYGRSTPIANLPADFHARAAEETRACLAALHLDRPVVWGHSDGAVIALLLALADPDAVAGVIVEAAHLYRRKPASRGFFEAMLDAPKVGESTMAALARDHGPQWPAVVTRHARAWLELGATATSDRDDFYDGRLADIEVPVLVVHGAKDPRTEPGEIEALAGCLSRPLGRHTIAVLPEGGHSPHSEEATADEVTRLVRTHAERSAESLALRRS